MLKMECNGVVCCDYSKKHESLCLFLISSWGIGRKKNFVARVRGEAGGSYPGKILKTRKHLLLTIDGFFGSVGPKMRLSLFLRTFPKCDLFLSFSFYLN